MTIPLFLCQMTTPLPVYHLIIAHNPTPVNKIFSHCYNRVLCKKKNKHARSEDLSLSCPAE